MKASRLKLKYVLPAIIFIIAIGFIFNVVKKPLSEIQPDKPGKQSEQPKEKAHSLPKNLEKQLLKDVKNDLSVIQSVENDTSMLEKAMAGKALESMVKNIENDAKKNMATRRKFDDIELYVSNYTKGVAAVSFNFIDMSYKYNIKTKRIITKPPSTKKSLALAVQKKDGTWKIIGIYNTEAKIKSKKARTK